MSFLNFHFFSYVFLHFSLVFHVFLFFRYFFEKFSFIMCFFFPSFHFFFIFSEVFRFFPFLIFHFSVFWIFFTCQIKLPTHRSAWSRRHPSHCDETLVGGMSASPSRIQPNATLPCRTLLKLYLKPWTLNSPQPHWAVPSPFLVKTRLLSISSPQRGTTLK